MTLSDLKRLIKVGTKMTLTYPDGGVFRKEVVIVNATQIACTSPDMEGKKPSYLSWPAATLVDARNDGFDIYDDGVRDMTPEERKAWDGRPIDKEQSMTDMMTDGTTMYYREKKYFMDKGMKHLLCYHTGASEKITHSEKDKQGYPRINTNKVKGKLSLSYKFVDKWDE